MSTQTGVIMRFDIDRGFGFIKPDGGGRDLFMHVSELQDMHVGDLLPGVTRVSYSEADSGKGLKAVHVRSVTGAGYPEQHAAPSYDGEPAPATVADWAALWAVVSEKAFAELLGRARANGWVQE